MSFGFRPWIPQGRVRDRQSIQSILDRNMRNQNYHDADKTPLILEIFSRQFRASGQMFMAARVIAKVVDHETNEVFYQIGWPSVRCTYQLKLSGIEHIDTV